MVSIRSSYVALCKSSIRLLIFRGRCPGGLLTCGPMCQCFTKPIHIPHEAEQRQKQHVVKLKKMREKWIHQRVKWWLLRPSNFFFSIITSYLQLNCGKGATLWFDASLLITTSAPWLGASRRLLCTVFRYGKWTRKLDVPHVGEWKYSFRYRGRAMSIHCLFLMKAIVSTVTTEECETRQIWFWSTDNYSLRNNGALLAIIAW